MGPPTYLLLEISVTVAVDELILKLFIVFSFEREAEFHGLKKLEALPMQHNHMVKVCFRIFVISSLANAMLGGVRVRVRVRVG